MIENHNVQTLLKNIHAPFVQESTISVLYIIAKYCLQKNCTTDRAIVENHAVLYCYKREILCKSKRNSNKCVRLNIQLLDNILLVFFFD